MEEWRKTAVSHWQSLYCPKIDLQSFMKVLITGAFGFVGTSLSKSLITFPKHRLIGIDIKEPSSYF